MFARKQTSVYYLGLSGFGLHLSSIWLVSACSSGFGQAGLRPADLDSVILTESIRACVNTYVTPKQTV